MIMLGKSKGTVIIVRFNNVTCYSNSKKEIHTAAKSKKKNNNKKIT